MSFEIPSHCTALLAAKAGSDLTFAEIAKAIGKPEVWTTAVFFGQARTDEATAKKLVEMLKIPPQYRYYWGEDPGTKTITDENIVDGLAGRGSGSMGVKGMVVRGGTWDGPPKDPVLYRLYEVLVVYGMSYKALIQEKFGDGIMSAIDFRTSLERKKDPKGDRVVITLDGKFLPYSPTEAWGA
ncbi:cyanase [Saitozyma sp. JCM 24511]|nr:cyanase [Saitozyma sp. JCM 24511]